MLCDDPHHRRADRGFRPDCYGDCVDGGSRVAVSHGSASQPILVRPIHLSAAVRVGGMYEYVVVVYLLKVLFSEILYWEALGWPQPLYPHPKTE